MYFPSFISLSMTHDLPDHKPWARWNHGLELSEHTGRRFNRETPQGPVGPGRTSGPTSICPSPSISSKKYGLPPATRPVLPPQDRPTGRFGTLILVTHSLEKAKWICGEQQILGQKKAGSEDPEGAVGEGFLWGKWGVDQARGQVLQPETCEILH